jgi:FkbM family methyltransferase
VDVRARLRAQLDRVRDALPLGHSRTSFAQEGEDLILERMFEHQVDGVYVDVGAHHPRRFSNTLLLYRRGWHGVNIDATPGSMDAFKKQRPRDINLEIGVTSAVEERDFYVFDEPALNTFDGTRAKSLDNPPYKITGVHKVKCAPLAAILKEHGLRTIDLLTIDAEGFDFEVLKTLDWNVSRPRVVVMEQHIRDVEEMFGTELHRYLRERGYRLGAKTFNSVFYSRSDSK